MPAQGAQGPSAGHPTKLCSAWDLASSAEIHGFRVYTAGQRSDGSSQTQDEAKAAVEPVIDHCKYDHGMDRNSLA